MTLAINVIDRHEPSNEMRRQLQPKTKERAIYIAAKDVLPILHYLQDRPLQFKKWVCCTGGKTFKWRLVHGVTLILMA